MTRKGIKVGTSTQITRTNSPYTGKYISRWGKYKPLDPKEEVEYIIRAKNGDQMAIQKIVNHNMLFVISVAKKYQFDGCHIDDLISAGTLGLISSINHFDTTKGFKFISYAVWWIRRYITMEIEYFNNKVHFPYNYQRKASSIKEYISNHESLDILSDEQIAKDVGIDIGLYHRYKGVADINIRSIDEHIYGEEENISMNDIIGTEDENIQKILNDGAVEIINILLKDLSQRERDMLYKYYGMCGEIKMGLKSIAEIYGISHERTRQILKKVLKHMKIKAVELGLVSEVKLNNVRELEIS